jgi:hypothetical protein
MKARVLTVLLAVLLAALAAGSNAWSADPGDQGDCTYTDSCNQGDCTYTDSCGQGDCTYTDSCDQKSTPPPSDASGDDSADEDQGDVLGEFVRHKRKSRAAKRAACLRRAKRVHGKAKRKHAVRRCNKRYPVKHRRRR